MISFRFELLGRSDTIHLRGNPQGFHKGDAGQTGNVSVWERNKPQWLDATHAALACKRGKCPQADSLNGMARNFAEFWAMVNPIAGDAGFNELVHPQLRDCGETS